MNGKGSVRFSELFADTARVMNETEMYCYYVLKGKMADWEFRFWMRTLAGK